MSRIEHLAEGVSLYLGDMLEILPTLGEFDACVTDPPYGIGEEGRRNATGNNSAKWRNAKPNDYGLIEWDSAPPSAEAIALIRSVAPWQIIFGGNYFELPPTPCWLVWDKQTNGNLADCELAWTNLPRAVRRISYLWNGFARANNEPRGDHPTQKPVGVMEWCIEQLPASVGTILDPFMGVASTGVAAIRRGKAFYGIEREPKYFDIAVRRIADELKRPRLALDAPRVEPKQEAFL